MTDSAEAYEHGKMGSQFVDDKDRPQVPAAPPPSGLLIEPVLAASMMAIFFAQTSLQNLYLKTACSVDLRFPHTVCERGVGEAFREAEIASQQLVSHINVSRGFVGAFISTVVLLFLGPWSDCSRRRKPLILISLLGMCISTLNVLIVITFPGLSTVWVLYMVQIPMSLGGNFALLLAAGFSYIGDVCHATGRNVTMSMGKHRAAVQVSTVAGLVCGPLMYRFCGFYGVFPIVFFLQASALVYASFRVKDVNINRENCVSLLDIRLPLSAAKCLFRPRAGRRRSVVLLMVVVALAERTVLAAEVVLMYMYVRNKYSWDDIMFGGFFAYRNIVSFIGTMIILRVFKSRMQLSDALVGVLSGVSLVLSEVVFMCARSATVVFLVPLVGIIAQGSQVVMRPILNKQIQPDEQGKIYSFVSALEQAYQMGVSPAFSMLYYKTAEVFPDAWLIPCAAIGAVSTVAYIVTRILSQKQVETEETNDDQERAAFVEHNETEEDKRNGDINAKPEVLDQDDKDCCSIEDKVDENVNKEVIDLNKDTNSKDPL